MRLGGSSTPVAGDHGKPPAFQVIILGAGGGPVEDNVTGLLVRSTSTNWAKGSVLAVDAGTHLAAVLSIINEHMPNALPRPEEEQSAVGKRTHSLRAANGHENGSPQVEGISPQLVLSTGPFADFELPHATAKANAAYFVRNLITTYLITHPHLDHISGFVINTAGFQHTSRPKRLAGLPSTIDAFKNHVFNDVLWPNLSDEDGGVGLVSYMRLAEGGNLAIGEGEGRGYIEVCDGLAVKSWSVSHGKCMHNHQQPKHGSGSGSTTESFNESLSRRPSQNIAMTPTGVASSNHLPSPHPGFCVTDSTAFFLRDDHTGNEILIFGDVEPDSLSLSPRTAQVWRDAAPKIVNGSLKGILIECSYDESQSDETLFGHLAPRHVIEELASLAEKVTALRMGLSIDDDTRKSIGGSGTPHSLKRKRTSVSSLSTTMFPDDTHDSRAGSSVSLPGHSIQRPSSANRGRKASRKKSGISPATIVRSPLVPLPVSSDPEQQTPSDEHQPPLHLDTTGREASDRRSTRRRSNSNTTDRQIPTPSTSNLSSSETTLPLAGVQVIIIHVKDNLKDGPEVGDTILTQLREREKEMFGPGMGSKGQQGQTGGLGCEFVISKSGTSVWL